MQHKTQRRNPSEARGNRRPSTDAGRLQRIEAERIRRQLQTWEEHVRKTEIGWLRCPQRKCYSVHSSNLQVNDICYWTYQGDLGIAIPDLNLHSDVRYQSFSFLLCLPDDNSKTWCDRTCLESTNPSSAYYSLGPKWSRHESSLSFTWISLSSTRDFFRFLLSFPFRSEAPLFVGAWEDLFLYPSPTPHPVKN